MRPLVPPGARVRVARCPLEALQVGDVAMFRRERSLVVHRVVARRSGAVAERGDASPAVRWRSAVEVVGRVEGVWRAGRYLDLRTGLGRWVSRLLDGRRRSRLVPAWLRRIEYAALEALLDRAGERP